MADDVLERLCRLFDLDATVVRQAAGSTAGSASPWYIRVAAGIGAWLTAAAMILVVGFLLAETLDGENLPLIAAGFGAVIAAGSLAFHRAGTGEFASQLGIAAALAGQALVTGGLGAEFESMTVAAAAACMAAALLSATARDPLQQFLCCALAVAVAFAALFLNDVPQAVGILAAVTLPPALALLVRPPARVDLRGLAWALLLVPLAVMAVPEVTGSGVDWPSRAAYAAALAAMLALVSRSTAPERRGLVLAGAVVALILGALASAGILASLTLLALAYLLGSRMLAALGAVAQVWFVSRFYYDLDLTQLEKSAMLTAGGLLLLALWWLWTRQMRIGEAGDA